MCALVEGAVSLMINHDDILVKRGACLLLQHAPALVLSKFGVKTSERTQHAKRMLRCMQEGDFDAVREAAKTESLEERAARLAKTVGESSKKEAADEEAMELRRVQKTLQVLKKDSWSKGVRMAVGGPAPAPANETSFQQLQKLHPQRQCTSTWEELESLIPEGVHRFDPGKAEGLKSVISRLASVKSGSATAMSGWTFELLAQTCSRTSTLNAWYRLYVGFITCSALLDEEFWSFISGARLFALCKSTDPNDPSVRPVAIGETVRRWFLFTAFRRLDPVVVQNAVGKYQYACGMPDGAVTMGRFIEAHVQKDPSLVVFSLDGKNAFNEFSRDGM